MNLSQRDLDFDVDHGRLTEAHKISLVSAYDQTKAQENSRVTQNPYDSGSESHVCVCLTKFPGFSAEQGEGRGSPGPAVREHTRNRTMASRCHEPGGRGVGERATSQRTEEVY